MIHSVRFICVLDTNVIYPIEIRDLLLWFAHYDLFTPKWSQHIFDEWEAVMRRKEIEETEIANRIRRVNEAFPEDYLSTFGLSAKSADDFLTDTIDLNPKQSIKAFRKLVLNRRNPDLDEFEVLDAFRRNGIKNAADYLHALL